jgi:hypothetical protein
MVSEYWGDFHTSAAKVTEKEPRCSLNGWVGGWVVPTAGLDAVENKNISRPWTESKPSQYDERVTILNMAMVYFIINLWRLRKTTKDLLLKQDYLAEKLV